MFIFSEQINYSIVFLLFLIYCFQPGAVVTAFTTGGCELGVVTFLLLKWLHLLVEA